MEVIFAPTLPDAFDLAGLPFPGEAEPGKMHRFATNGRAHDKAGWLRVFDDQNGAVFGCWRDGTEYTWQRESGGGRPDAEELARIRAVAEFARKAAEEAREREYQEAAKKAEQVWQESEPATSHGYLSAKGIGPHIARVHRRGWLSIPVFDVDGKLQSLQSVSPTGEKRFLPGGRMSGGRCWIGEPSEAGPLVICEGYATGASVREATGWPVCVAFNAGNLRPVAESIRERFPNAKMVIAGDDDRATEGNPGRTKAEDAAKAVGAIAVFPRFAGLAGSDFNDMAQQQGKPAVAREIRQAVEQRRFNLAESTAARLFCGEPPEVKWLVHGIFPRGVAAVLASPAGIGKSYLALDLARAVATDRSGDLPAFCFGAMVGGHGRAVYVSAEDDLGELHRRLHSLCGFEPMPERLHVLSLPDVGHFGIIECDRQTREYKPTAAWRDLADEIRALDDVRLVVLDTLQALTSGDTNTAEAVQPLMNEAAALAAATGATVLLIHHVAKGSTREIKTALDAAEAIRGSGAIVGSARACYVLWPPSDGGGAICETLGERFEEGRAAIGLVAKANGQARRERTIFLRDAAGLLRDVTQKYRALAGTDEDAMRGELLGAIRAAWAKGEAFAASAGGQNGIHARRFELPEAFHEKARPWFEEQAGRLLADGAIKRASWKGGQRLVPAFAKAAMPEELDQGEGRQ